MLHSCRVCIPGRALCEAGCLPYVWDCTLWLFTSLTPACTPVNGKPHRHVMLQRSETLASKASCLNSGSSPSACLYLRKHWRLHSYSCRQLPRCPLVTLQTPPQSRDGRSQSFAAHFGPRAIGTTLQCFCAAHLGNRGTIREKRGPPMPPLQARLLLGF